MYIMAQSGLLGKRDQKKIERVIEKYTGVKFGEKLTEKQENIFGLEGLT